MSHPNVLLRAVACVALGLGVVACGDSRAGERSGMPRRDLVLEIAGPEPVRGRVDVVRSWEIDDGAPNGFRSSAPVREFEFVGDTEVLRLAGTRRVELHVTGPHHPEFDQVRVVVGGAAPCSVGLHLRRNGLRVISTPVQRHPGTDGLVTYVFDVPAAERSSEPFDVLEVAFTDCTDGAQLSSVALLDRSDLDWLPTVEEPRRVSIGGESRVVVGIDTGTRLVTSFVPRPGEDLEFSFGRPESVQRPDDALSLRVSLWPSDPEEERVVEEWTLEPTNIETPWRMVRVEIDPRFANEPMTAVFEVLAEGFDHGTMVLEPPRLSRRTRDEVLLLVTVDGLRLDDTVRGPEGEALIADALGALEASGSSVDAFSSSDDVVGGTRALLRGLPVGAPDFDDAPSLAEVLRGQGWSTCAVVSDARLGEASGLARGFDRFSAPVEGQRTASLSFTELPTMLGELSDRPLFVWFHVNDPLAPYDAPREYTRSYPLLKTNGMGEDLDPLPRHLKAWWRLDVRDMDWLRDQYRAEISRVDHTLGKLLRMERSRQAHVALTAPVGQGFGEAGLAWRHTDLLPAALRVPLVISGPDVDELPAGPPAAVEDTGRTLMNLAGLDEVAFPGRDLLDTTGPFGADDWEKLALDGVGRSASLVADGHLAVLYLEEHSAPDGSPRPRHGMALFDLAEDRDTATDLAAEDPALARQLRAKLVARLAALAEPLIDPACACEQCAASR